MVYKSAIRGEGKFQEAIKISKKEGLISLFYKLFLYFIYPPINYALTVLSSAVILFKPKRFFPFQGKKLPYFYNRYNTTWKNERTVEVPIVIDYIKGFYSRKKRILEFGAVLVHYYPAKWDILDKYERGKGIINKDIIDFKPLNKYDMIVSISTLEHVGFDEEIKDSAKISEAIRNIRKNFLNPGGIGVITMPIGYNAEMDRLLFANKLEFDKKIFMKRINKKNQWIEIIEEEAKKIKYGKPFSSANSIVIGIIEK